MLETLSDGVVDGATCVAADVAADIGRMLPPLVRFAPSKGSGDRFVKEEKGGKGESEKGPKGGCSLVYGPSAQYDCTIEASFPVEKVIQIWATASTILTSVRGVCEIKLPST